MGKNIFAALLEKIFSSPEKNNVSETQEILNEDKVTPITISATESDSSPDAVNRLCTSIAQGAAFVFDFTTSDNVTIPKGMICENRPRIDNEIGCVTLSRGNPQAPAGGITGGYSIRLPDEIEAAATEHRITLSVIARASNRTGSRFAIAYSTNGSGNSGWRWYDAASEWSIHTMEYNVPVIKQKNGNFIGILVEDEDQSGSEFCYLTIHIHQ